ncbi:MAG: hypothetical protein AB8C95_00725 [Phycisphaeraceae bacterium]
MRRYTLITAFTIAAICCSFIATEQTACAQNASAKYKANITITVATPGGQPRVITLPTATIQMGNAQTIKFEVGQESFHFDMVVKPNQKQILVAKTTGRLKVNGKQLTSPTIEQQIGTTAEIKTADISMKVTYTPVNG